MAHAGCSHDYHYQGKPTDCSLSLGLLLLLLLLWWEKTLNSTLKPNHVCAHEDGLNNGVLRRSGKKAKAGA